MELRGPEGRGEPTLEEQQKQANASSVPPGVKWRLWVFPPNEESGSYYLKKDPLLYGPDGDFPGCIRFLTATGIDVVTSLPFTLERLPTTT
jgi:hypothetical protein